MNTVLSFLFGVALSAITIAPARAQSAHDSIRVTLYPNPSCQGTTIIFSVPRESDVIEAVAYDVTGRRVATLARNEGAWFLPGRHMLPLTGYDVNGEPLTPGYYALMVLSRGEIIGSAKYVNACSFR